LREQGVPEQRTRGEIVSSTGKVMGEHAGVHHFTVGQRKGLGIAVGEPLYVIATNPATQQVIVGKGEELLRAQLTAREVNWISIPPVEEPCRAEVKIRNKHVAAAATLYPSSDSGKVEVRFDEPQRAVTPGQAAVFYRGDLVLGGGWIS
jgi:tRNA-uridine 2-sulfurtransferase